MKERLSRRSTQVSVSSSLGVYAEMLTDHDDSDGDGEVRWTRYLEKRAVGNE